MKILAVATLLCALMVLTTATGTESGTLDLFKFPWVEIGQRFFYYVTRPMTWPEAELNCRSLGGHLASVQSLKEYNALRRMIGAPKSNPLVWLGGSDRLKEGKWLWSDGSSFKFKYWCPGQPNNHRDQDCMQMNFGKCKCWNDKGCETRLPSFCIKKS